MTRNYAYALGCLEGRVRSAILDLDYNNPKAALALLKRAVAKIDADLEPAKSESDYLTIVEQSAIL
jgi:hypothetical protein